MKRICVYCASSTNLAPIYVEHAIKLATILANNNIQLVFGGGRAGLMGVLADKMNEMSGTTIGIMPHFMKDVEWHHENLTEMIWTDTMSQRKELMIENVDAVITLPGGCGTMEEFMETLSLKRLGMFIKPMIILNTNNFYDPLIDLLDAMVHENFLGSKHSDMYEVVNKPEDILEAIRRSKPWDASAKSFALVK
ncbi:MAG: TIGR00730 family Rossman fold protein [Bacteroidales bacterium]|nr:TIGR00730 family Rossman fold protein [Bacteroidales bacterium]